MGVVKVIGGIGIPQGQSGPTEKRDLGWLTEAEIEDFENSQRIAHPSVSATTEPPDIGRAPERSHTSLTHKARPMG